MKYIFIVVIILLIVIKVIPFLLKSMVRKSETTSDYSNDFSDISLVVKNINVINNEIVIIATLPETEQAVKIIFKNTDYGNFEFSNDNVVFESMGNPSDLFLKNLSELYGIPKTGMKMKDRVVMTSFALEGDPRKIKESPVAFKLFYDKEFTNPESDEANDFYENEYFEVFLNVDLPNKKIEIAEKDQEYRGAIVNVFTSQ